MESFTLRLPGHLSSFLDGKDNRSEYIRSLIERRMAEVRAAEMRLETYPQNVKMAVFDVMNGHIYVDGLPPSVEVTANLEDAEGLGEKWGITDFDWDRLMSMNDDEGRAWRVLSEEFWARGR